MEKVDEEYMIKISNKLTQLGLPNKPENRMFCMIFNNPDFVKFAEKDGESYVIECKKYKVTHKVSRRDLMLLESARHYFNRDKALFVTLGYFPRTAVQYAKEVKMGILDGNELVKIHNKNIINLKPKIENKWDKFLYDLAEHFYKEDAKEWVITCPTCGCENVGFEECPKCHQNVRIIRN